MSYRHDRRWQHAYHEGADARGRGEPRINATTRYKTARDQAAWRAGWEHADRLMRDQLKLPGVEA